MEEDKKIEVYTGDSLSNTIPTSVVLTGEDALSVDIKHKVFKKGTKPFLEFR